MDRQIFENEIAAKDKEVSQKYLSHTSNKAKPHILVVIIKCTTLKNLNKQIR